MSQKKNKFWSVKAEASASGGKVGNLYLYGIVSSESWWGDEVTPKQLIGDLKALGEINSLKVHIFSDGGDVFAGTAIYSILKQQAIPVHVYIEGIAASIATVIAMAGDQIFISRTALMMVHNPMFGMRGFYNANELQRMIDDLGKIRKPLIAVYQARTGMDYEAVIEMLNGENGEGTWYTAEEAIAVGLADAYIPNEVEESLEPVACLKKHVYQWNGYTFDLSGYTNVPEIKNRRRKKTMGFGGIKKKVKAVIQAKVKAEFITVTCPECGATFDVTLEEGGAENAIYEITCPECNATFEWSDGEGEGESGEEASAEIISVTCPECGATFEWDTGSTEPEPDEGTTENRYSSGVIAERKRINALDSIVEAHPESAAIVAQGKKEGWSYTHTSQKVFASMAHKKAANKAQGNKTKADFLAHRKTEHQESGVGEIGAAKNLGPADESEEAQAVAMILAGVKKK